MITRNDTQTQLKSARRLRGLQPYMPTHSAKIDLRLDANEGGGDEALCRYPDASVLERKLAERWQIESSRIVVTNGGDDAIDRVCRAVLDEGSVALLHTPTFEMIEHSARLAGGEMRRIGWLDTPFPVSSFIEQIDDNTRLVALVTPNNPTGGAIALRDIFIIAQAARRVGAVVLIDLAYVEFADANPTGDLLALPNVVVIRTFSKAMGLAGLRVGYAIASPQVAHWLRTVGGPYPVSSISLKLAGEMLDREADRAPFIERIKLERAKLREHFLQLGATTLPTQANFVTARFDDAELVRRKLAENGIAVRGFRTGSAMAEYLRITLPGHEQQFDRLLHALVAAMKLEKI